MSRTQGRHKVGRSHSLSTQTVDRLASFAFARGGESAFVDRAINKALDKEAKRRERGSSKPSADQPEDLKPARHKVFLEDLRA